MNLDYELLTLDQRQAHFQFQGRFKTEVVTWDVRLEAIDPMDESPRMQSMVIDADNKDKVLRVHLKLAISKVTKAEILKSITMLLNYKNLGTGTHKWSG